MKTFAYEDTNRDVQKTFQLPNVPILQQVTVDNWGGGITPFNPTHKKVKRVLITVTYDFDEVADGCIINSSYVTEGLTIDGYINNSHQGLPVYAKSYNDADTPPNIITLDQNNLYFDGSQGAIRISFPHSVYSVSIRAKGYFDPNHKPEEDIRPYIQAYSKDPNTGIYHFQSQTFYPYPTTDDKNWGTWQTLQCVSPQKYVSSIDSILISSQQPKKTVPHAYGYFDTLSYSMWFYLLI